VPTCVVSSLLILLDNESSVKLRFGIFSLDVYLLALASTRTGHGREKVVQDILMPVKLKLET
jgi:hypothetical protein